MAEGLQIGELPQKENLTGNELIPFQQGSSNGSMSTATLKKYIGTGGGTGGGTDYMNYITEYNVSVHHPTSGTDGTNRYTLETAIVQVPPELRNIGLKVSFINSAGKVETWEFQGGTFTDVDGWTDGTEKIAKLERILFIDKAESVLAFPLSSPKKMSYWNLAIPDTTFKKCSAIRFTAWAAGAKIALHKYNPSTRKQTLLEDIPTPTTDGINEVWLSKTYTIEDDERFFIRLVSEYGLAFTEHDQPMVTIAISGDTITEYRDRNGYPLIQLISESSRLTDEMGQVQKDVSELDKRVIANTALIGELEKRISTVDESECAGIDEDSLTVTEGSGSFCYTVPFTDFAQLDITNVNRRKDPYKALLYDRNDNLILYAVERSGNNEDTTTIHNRSGLISKIKFVFINRQDKAVFSLSGKPVSISNLEEKNNLYITDGCGFLSSFDKKQVIGNKKWEILDYQVVCNIIPVKAGSNIYLSVGGSGWGTVTYIVRGSVVLSKNESFASKYRFTPLFPSDEITEDGFIVMDQQNNEPYVIKTTPIADVPSNYTRLSIIAQEESDSTERVPSSAYVKKLVSPFQADYYSGMVVGFVGDSYADNGANIFTPAGELYHPTYPEIFARKHPTAITIDKCKGGAAISTGGSYGQGIIYNRAKSIIDEYGDKLSVLPYPIGKSDNLTHSIEGGKIHLGIAEMDYIVANIYPNSADSRQDRLTMRVYSYNEDGTYTKLCECYVQHEMSDRTRCIKAFYFDKAVKANEGETLAVDFIVWSTSFGTSDSAVFVVNDSGSYVCNGESENGTPLMQFGTLGKLDYMVFQGGINDQGGGAPIGKLTDSYDMEQNFDPATFYGAVEAMVVYARKNSKRTRLGFVIMPYRMDDYSSAIKAVCKKWGVPVMDTNELIGVMTNGLNGQYPARSDGAWWTNNPYYNINPNGESNNHPSPILYNLVNGMIMKWIETL